MSNEPMRPPRRQPRVPGFPPPAEPTPPAAPATSDLLASSAGTRQLSVRITAPLLDHHKRLLRRLADDGLQVSLTESTQAILFAAADAEALRAAVRTWRRAVAERDAGT